MESVSAPSRNAAEPAVLITRAASEQTYYTIRYLVDRDRVSDAYRAYAYFRWVDDWLDQDEHERAERIAFVNRQIRLVDQGYNGGLPGWDLAAEEHMAIDLIRADPDRTSGLHTYIRNMLAVMAFDAERRGRLISRAQLAEYTRCLATAVTEAMHYFIGHHSASPHGHDRYLAVAAAHITHMLRDTYEDVQAGYFNISYEFLDEHDIQPWDIDCNAYTRWVEARVQAARACFQSGRQQLANVQNVRCRLAGLAYVARFEHVLKLIELDGYRLRRAYPELKGAPALARLAWPVLSMLVDPVHWGGRSRPAHHTAGSNP